MSSQASCQICEESRSDGVFFIRVGIESGGEHFKKHACDHKFCQDCLQGWVRSCLSSMAWAINCPADGCSFKLYPDDVSRITSEEEGEIFRARIASDYTTRLDHEDDDFRLWAQENAKRCPRCSVLLIRYEGCSAMACTCGTRFCYNCVHEQCICKHCMFCIWTFDHDSDECTIMARCTLCEMRGHDADNCDTVCNDCKCIGHTTDKCFDPFGRLGRRPAPAPLYRLPKSRDEAARAQSESGASTAVMQSSSVARYRPPNSRTADEDRAWQARRISHPRTSLPPPPTISHHESPRPTTSDIDIDWRRPREPSTQPTSRSSHGNWRQNIDQSMQSASTSSRASDHNQVDPRRSYQPPRSHREASGSRDRSEHERTQRQPVSRAHIVVSDHTQHASDMTSARGMDHGRRALNTWAGYLALIDPETY